MHRAIALAATVVSTVALADPPPPPRPSTARDKIVRVERERARGRSLLFCEVRQDRSGGSCFGSEAPHPGDRMAVVDEHHRIAEARVTGAVGKEGKDGACSVMWEVTYEITSGSLASEHTLTGVIGADVQAGGHRVAEESRAKIPATAGSACKDDEQIVIGIDRDGDGKLDVAATFCTAGGGYGGDFFVNVWMLDNDKQTQTKVQTITPLQLQPCLH